MNPVGFVLVVIGFLMTLASIIRPDFFLYRWMMERSKYCWGEEHAHKSIFVSGCLMMTFGALLAAEIIPKREY